MKARRWLQVIYVSATLASVGLATTTAHGQSNAAAAEALFDEGRKAMDQKDYATACGRFRESNRLDPAPGTVLNLARCEEARGKVATAWELYKRALDQLPPSDDRANIAKKRVEALASRLPKLTLRMKAGSPDGAVVRIPDADLELKAGSLGTPLPIDPGKHEIVVRAPGFQQRSFSVELSESEQRELEVSPGSPSESGADAPGTDQGSSRRTWGYVAGGIGVAGLGLGTIAGILALGKKSDVDADCPADKLCNSSKGPDAADSGRTLARLSTVGWIVGAVGVGAGAYLILSSDSGGSKTALQASPTVGGAQLGLFRTW